MAESSPSTSRKDPLTVFCFSLQIDSLGITSAQAFFKQISGLTSESEVVEYKEGGHNTGARRLVGPAKWPNLVLKQGFTGPPWTLLNWRLSLLNDGSEAFQRADGKIYALDSALQPVCTWKFSGGWPVKWVGPEFDASKQELAIEQLEIAHDGLSLDGGSGGA